jgi:hypothetical protein
MKTPFLVVLALVAAAGQARAAEVVSVVVQTQTVMAAPGANLTTRSGAGAQFSAGTWYSVLPAGGRLVAWRLGVDPSSNDSSKVRVTCALEAGQASSWPSFPAPVYTAFADFAWTPGLPLRDAPATVPAALVFVAGESTVWLSVHVRNGSAAPVNASCKVFLFFEVS